MPVSLKRALNDLEAECAARCREHAWLDDAGEPAFALLDAPRSAFRRQVDVMLLDIHPKPLDDAQATKESDALPRRVAEMVASDPDALLRRTPRAFMLPFRTPSIARLPDALRKEGLAIGGQLVALIRPRILVLLGGDRVLFASAIGALPGRRVDAHEETFGTTRRAYRDVTVAGEDGATFAAVLPLHAIEDGLATLRRRLESRRPLAEAS